MADSFELDARIERDSVSVGRLPLCEVRLHRDARYPWVLLVPARAGVREIHELSARDRVALIEESSAVAAAMQRLFEADKMNVAALGNMVPQLHVHHVARFVGDDAWPGAIWGAHPAMEYPEEARTERVAALRAALASIDGFR
ncbi:MAG: HIT domain-containing protein [Sandaracinaceae bacterium]